MIDSYAGLFASFIAFINWDDLNFRTSTETNQLNDMMIIKVKVIIEADIEVRGCVSLFCVVIYLSC